jgi:alpha-L-rhamnosidase
LILEYDDNSIGAIGSDASWKQTNGPIVLDDIYIGETYDSRLQTPGWDQPGFNDSSWNPAELLSKTPTGQLNVSMIPPVRSLETFSAKSIKETEPGKFVFDFGQNMAGHCSLHIPGGGRAGSNVTLLHAEMIYQNGTIHHLYPNSPELNVYIFNGDESEVDYEPQFSYYGFRYVQAHLMSILCLLTSHIQL